MANKPQLIKSLFIGLLAALSVCVQAQVTGPDTLVISPKTLRPVTVINGDTIPWDLLDEVLVISTPTFSDAEARKRYYLLMRRVIKVYPYAVEAGNRLDSLNLKLDGMSSNRKKKKYVKQYQKFLEERFEPELRELTRSEGQILSKLIYRETGMSVHDLIKEYKSGWSAFWWDAKASWFDIDLKRPYDPETNEEDQFIEGILRRAFSNGQLIERVPFYPPKPGPR